MQPIHKYTGGIAGNRGISFLRNSFFFALLYSTLLYCLVRAFFYDFPFTIGEAFELHIKILLVVWSFIIACKLVIAAIVLIENNLHKIKYARMAYLPALKNLLVLLATTLSISSGVKSTVEHNIANTTNNFNTEPVIDSELAS